MHLHVSEITRHNQPIVANECLARCAHALLAVGGKWDVRCACVAAIERPLRLAMADNEDARIGHFISLSLSPLEPGSLGNISTKVYSPQ